jgi:hypothetical protein
MKKFKYSIVILLTLALFSVSCQDEDFTLGEITAPSNIQIEVDIVGVDANNPNGDGSGTVNFKASADNAISYHFVYNGIITSASNGMISYDFSVLGLNTYTVTVVAYGTAGASSSRTIEVEVLSLYEPPADLVTMLNANSSRSWKIKSDAGNHFGLGSIGGPPFEYYGANPGDKTGVGMYDDRYIFNVNGTFTHITNATNDDPTVDTSGTVFGRKVLIDELGGSGGTQNGDDIENYPFSDYTAQYSLTAPGGVETISLSGLAFIGYYVGGDHKYQIYSRSANEMVLKITDGNNQFDWWFTLVPE